MRFLTACLVLGAIVPVVLLAKWLIFHEMFGMVEFLLWPSSIMTMILDGHEHVDTFAIVVYAISILTNVMLYFIAGFIVWQIYRGAQKCVAWLTNKAYPGDAANDSLALRSNANLS